MDQIVKWKKYKLWNKRRNECYIYHSHVAIISEKECECISLKHKLMYSSSNDSIAEAVPRAWTEGGGVTSRDVFESIEYIQAGLS